LFPKTNMLLSSSLFLCVWCVFFSFVAFMIVGLWTNWFSQITCFKQFDYYVARYNFHVHCAWVLLKFLEPDLWILTNLEMFLSWSLWLLFVAPYPRDENTHTQYTDILYILYIYVTYIYIYYMCVIFLYIINVIHNAFCKHIFFSLEVWLWPVHIFHVFIFWAHVIYLHYTLMA
jgi:hypothetical protein